MSAYKVLNGTAPIYLNALAKAYVTTQSFVRQRVVIWRCLYHAQDNLDSFHASFHDGEMTYQMLQEQRRPCLSLGLQLMTILIVD